MNILLFSDEIKGVSSLLVDGMLLLLRSLYAESNKDILFGIYAKAVLFYPC